MEIPNIISAKVKTPLNTPQYYIVFPLNNCNTFTLNIFGPQNLSILGIPHFLGVCNLKKCLRIRLSLRTTTCDTSVECTVWKKKSTLIPVTNKKKYINFRSLHNILRPFLWRKFNSIQGDGYGSLLRPFDVISPAAPPLPLRSKLCGAAPEKGGHKKGGQSSGNKKNRSGGGNTTLLEFWEEEIQPIHTHFLV